MASGFGASMTVVPLEVILKIFQNEDWDPLLQISS